MAELSARVAKSAEQFQDGTLDVRAKGVDQIDDQQSAQLDGGVVYRGDYFNSLNPAGAILTAVNCDAPRTAGLTAPSHPLPPPPHHPHPRHPGLTLQQPSAPTAPGHEHTAPRPSLRVGVDTVTTRTSSLRSTCETGTPFRPSSTPQREHGQSTGRASAHAGKE